MGRQRKVDFIPLETARNRLTSVWLIGAGVVFLPLFVQSILGKYGDSVDAVWSWFIPTCIPTVSLMVGVLGATAFDNNEKRKVKVVFYRIALWLSVAYLGVILLTIGFQPFSNLEPLDVLKRSNYWLSPIQGVAVGVIGYLFTAQKMNSSAGDEKPEAE